MIAPAPLLEVRGLSKRLGGVPILRSISLDFPRGDRALLLGANGAGKTTLLRTLSGLLRPDQGAITNPSKAPIGFVGHHLLLYGRLTVLENLRLFAPSSSIQDIDSEIGRWSLGRYRDRPVSELSKGNQVKTSIVRALIARPDILIFDEPSSNLDESATEILKGALTDAKAASGEPALTIVATHDVHRLASIATRAIVLQNGQVISDSGSAASPSSVSELVEQYREGNR